MLILGLDCSSASCSVAISRGGTALAREHMAMARGHAAALPPMISATLNAAGKTARDLDAIAVSTGPGSFTGLRVGMAAAKGLALALDRPLIGVSCFDAIARRATQDRNRLDFDFLLLALASKREEIFVLGLDSQGTEIIGPRALTPISVDERFGSMMGKGHRLYLAGEAANSLADALQRAGSRCRARIEIGPARPPDAAEIAFLAHDALDRDPAPPRVYETGLAPLYIRPQPLVAPGP